MRLIIRCVEVTVVIWPYIIKMELNKPGNMFIKACFKFLKNYFLAIVYDLLHNGHQLFIVL